MVVDLSAGPDASTYPVTYLPAVPAEGWSVEYQTDKLVLRRIKPGTFLMGSPPDELGHIPRSETQREVTLTRPYYIGVFKVTQRQWELVTGDNPSYFKNPAHYATRPVEQVSYDMIRGTDEGAKWPQDNKVDSESFMDKLRARTGQAFDLPTEAQWEYACRAGTTTALNSGKNLTDAEKCPNLDELGRYLGNGGDQRGSNVTVEHGTAKVDAYKPNAWGLYGMHGGWEWCLDWWAPATKESVTDPKGHPDAQYSGRSTRGGRIMNPAAGCRTAYRVHGYKPDSNNYTFGLRVAVQEVP